jgi:iron complex outermembrane receptor protein
VERRPYLQTQWQLTDKLSLDAGVRYSSVWFDSNDYYITPGNGDDSGDASYHKWLPAGSLKYALTDAWNVYLSAGRGFETTINELSYRSDNQSGLNFGLKPSTNDTVEIGSKTRIGNGLFTAALFQTNTDNEIVVDSSSGGRTSYKNAGKTRQGMELGLDQQFGELASEGGLDLAGRDLSHQRLRRQLQRQPHSGDRAQYGLRLLWLSAGAGLVRRQRYSLYERYHGQ